MGPLDFLLHLVNFLLPALTVSASMTALGLFWRKKRPFVQHLWAQFAINFALCTAVSVAGLLFFGVDGKMATYGALCLVGGLGAWVMSGAARGT